VTLVGATFTPDGTSVDFVRQTAGAPAWEVWRVPLLGGTPRLFVANVASPISWSPDDKHLAFMRTQVTPSLSSQLIVTDADGGQERELARSESSLPWISLVAPWRPSVAPAWSPDGRLIAVSAASSSTGRVVFVDSRTGSIQEVTVPNGTTSGLSWLDAESLVVNQPAVLGAINQLLRLPYPAGPLSRVTNDPNDYLGISLSGDRDDLVTGRRDTRMDVWVGDGGAATGSDVVQRVPVLSGLARVSWAGNGLLYGGVIGGRPAILRMTPGEGGAEEVVFDALSPVATSDGRTILFVSSSTENPLHLWTADATGRRGRRLVPSVTASQMAITPDDRSVLYTSLLGGTVSIWMVPLEGGTPTKLADGGNAAVSPDGASMAFTALGPAGGSVVVCGLSGCTSPRPIGPVGFDALISWTPDGRGIAYASEGNLWVQALSGGAPRQLTRFTDRRPIESFAWSRDGKRLAIARVTVTNDIVLFEGLK